MANPRVIYRQNDNYLEVSNVRNAISGAYLNDADVEVTLVDNAGTELDGQVWPLALSYVAASNGKYRVKLPAAINSDDIEDGVAQLSIADAGSGLAAYFLIPLDFQHRTG